ncbi:MAG TPA: hypothetical protein VHS28_11445, partial [Chloroflexota bacterium]|nr:hypothetical protein [Chloroflexota bacterium]
MGNPLQLIHPLDLQPCAADARYVGAHLHQEVGQVHHFRLHRGVLYDGLAPGKGRGHQQILRAGVAGVVQVDAGTVQPLGGRGDVVASGLFHMC